MFLYFGKTFTSHRVGERLVRVECERCGGEFFFQLNRIGNGSGEAPYYIGQGRAARAAERRAVKDLERRLERETELVPCPKCSWINEQLVDGYRRTRYKFLGKVASYICAAAVILALTLLPLLAFREPAAVLPVAVVLLGIVLLAGGVLVVRAFFRSRIRPNANYPDAVQVPPGTPPALVKDAVTGRLVAAREQQVSAAPIGECYDFQVGRHFLPMQCCDCLKETDIRHAHKLLATAVWLLIPRCQDCAQVARRAYWRAFYKTALIAVGVSAAVILPFNLAGENFYVATFWAFVVSAIVAAVVAHRSSSPVKVAHTDRARRVIRLRFRNPAYGRLVAAANDGVPMES